MLKIDFYMSKYGVDVCKFGVATQGRMTTSRLYYYLLSYSD